MFRYVIQVWFRETPFVAAVVALVTTLLLPHGAAAAPTDTFCTPDQVVVFTNAPRLHVHCAAAVGGISYFAVSTSDQAQAARVLSVISTALIAGRTLVIRYDPNDLSGAAIGCLNSDCRLIQAVGFGK
jgi:hypothetical protein